MALEKLLDKPLTIPENLKKVKGDERGLLKSLQGNILKAHGRSHTAHVFVQFSNKVDELRKGISDLARSDVTSAWDQEEQARAWRHSRQDGGCFVSVLLSYSGYQRLGISADEIPDDPIFRTGMRSTDGIYFQWTHDTWNQQFGARVDGMLLVADNNHGQLQDKVRRIQNALNAKGLAESFKVHPGSKQVDQQGQPVEWFGFRDNISQPQVVRRSRSKESKSKWETLAPLNLVLAAEPGGKHYGSYMAFQKLEQNVRKFRTEMARLAKQLGGVSVDDVAALAVGRTLKGVPLIPLAKKDMNKVRRIHESGDQLTPKERDELNRLVNNFNYNGKDGSQCPFHAHIRKVNPRGEIKSREYPAQLSTEEEKQLQIIRRGIPYDERSDDEKRNSDEWPESRVGLLFISYQRELAQFLAKLWMAQSNNFVRPRVGPDPLLARGDKGSAQEWQLNGITVRQQIADFVTLKGGEYLFAPSVPFLKSLG